MIPQYGYGFPTRVTGTGLSVIASRDAAVVGVLCCNSATQGAIQLFCGTTATATASGRIGSGVITFASGSISQFIFTPLDAKGGLIVNIGAAANPDLTIYWNPV